MPGFPVLHYLPEFTQTHIHCVSDAWGRRESSVTQIPDWCLRATCTHMSENTVHAYMSHMHTQCLIHCYFCRWESMIVNLEEHALLEDKVLCELGPTFYVSHNFKWGPFVFIVLSWKEGRNVG